MGVKSPPVATKQTRTAEGAGGCSTQVETYQALLNMSRAIISCHNISELAAAIAQTIADLTRAHYFAIQLIEEESKTLVSHIVEIRGEYRATRRRALELRATPGGYAFLEQARVVISDFRTEDRWPAGTKVVLGEYGCHSAVYFPMTTSRQRVGVMTFLARPPNAFDPAEVDLLGRVADQVAVAVENILHHEEAERLRREVERQRDRLAREKIYLQDEVRAEYDTDEIVGRSDAIKQVLEQVRIVAATDATVLICGETGTGKELIARALHHYSGRKSHVFVKMNCAAIPAALLESDLFGHEKGAYTGAASRRIGRFELANDGTLFLDEIGDLPLELQPKLLRVLQEHEFERLGGHHVVQTNARVIAATNRNLKAMADQGKFRPDLFYRLNVFPIELPPLRERRVDIPLLVHTFAQRYAARLGKRIEKISDEQISALRNYDWPGNLRELQNFVERAVILSPGPALELPVDELQRATHHHSHSLSRHNGEAAPISHERMEAMQRKHILSVLRETRWVIGGPRGAAARLGMKRTTLISRMQKLGIERPS